jgi:hypothetical protein
MALNETMCSEESRALVHLQILIGLVDKSDALLAL